MTLLIIPCNPVSEGKDRFLKISLEAGVAGPHRFTYDYKPADFAPQRPIRRVPWFVAGVGLPLICVGLIATVTRSPEPDADEATAVAEATVAAAEIASGEVPADALTEESAAAATNVDSPIAAEDPAIAQADAAEPGSSLTMVVRSGDSLDRMFKRNSLDRTDLANIMALDIARKHLRLIKPGDEIQVRQDDGNVLRLDRPISLGEILSIRRTTDGYIAETIEVELDAQPVRATGTINSSLFLAAAEAGISDRTIMNLAGIFAWDVDFMLDIREGDQFTLVFEEIWKKGERVAEGEILAAEFVNQGERFRAIRFQDASGRVDY